MHYISMFILVGYFKFLVLSYHNMVYCLSGIWSFGFRVAMIRKTYYTLYTHVSWHPNVWLVVSQNSLGPNTDPKILVS